MRQVLFVDADGNRRGLVRYLKNGIGYLAIQRLAIIGRNYINTVTYIMQNACIRHILSYRGYDIKKVGILQRLKEKVPGMGR
jgi:hypothetical protein